MLDTALHWDGRRWKSVSINGTRDDNSQIQGTGPNDIYVLTTGTSTRDGDLFRWDGTAWKVVRPGGKQLNDGKSMRLDSDGSIWITDLGWTDCSLAVVRPSGTWSCIYEWAFGSRIDLRVLDGKVWLLEKESDSYWISFWDGATWRKFPFQEELRRLQVFSPTEALASTTSGVWRWNGSQWAPPDASSRNVWGMWARNSTDVWGWNGADKTLGLWRYDGSTWKKLTNYE